MAVGFTLGEAPVFKLATSVGATIRGLRLESVASSVAVDVLRPCSVFFVGELLADFKKKNLISHSIPHFVLNGC